MATRHRDFKIKAWPFVSHTSNVDRSETDILWPLIRYERNGTKKKFSIRPFFFKYERDTSTNALTIMFLFYSILYKVSIDAVTLFLLPLLTFHRKSKTAQTTMILGGLLYFLRRTFSAVQQTRFMAILPFMYFSNETKRTDNDMIFQTLFPFFWKYKTKETHLVLVLPFYFFFENAKYKIKQMWPFFGTQSRPGKYQEWSLLYPLFRVRKGSGNFTLHIPWPFLKYEMSPEKYSLRFLPFCWIRFLKKGGSRGFVLFFYWKHVSSKNCSEAEPAKFTFGIWGLLHIKISLDKGKSQGHHIFWIFMLFLYFKNSEKVLTFITPLFMHSKHEKQQTRRLYLFPFFYYSKYDSTDWHCLVPLLFTYVRRSFYNYSTSNTTKTLFTSLLVFWFYKNRYSTDKTVSTSYNHAIFPLYWVYREIGVKEEKKSDETTRLFLIPLLFYYFKEDICGTSKVDTLANLFYIFYYRNNKEKDHKRMWFFPIFYYSNIRKEKTFLLSLLLFYRKSEEKNYFSLLIIYSNIQKKNSYKLVTYPFFLYVTYTGYKYNGDVYSHTRLFVGGLFGHRKVLDQVIIWIFVCYCSNISKDTSVRVGSFFLLPPYFYHCVEDGKVTMSTVFPFYFYNRDWKYTFIFPFFFIRNDRNKKSAHLHFIFDLMIDSDTKTYYFKLFYIPRTRYSLIQYDSKYIGHKVGSSSMRRWRLFVFPFFYFENRSLETPDLTSSEAKHYTPLITIALFWLLKDLSLGRITLDYREMVKSIYILPFFYIKIDRNNQVVNALRNGQYLSFSLIYFFSEKVALFRYTRLITPNAHRSSMFVFLLFFSSVRNWWTGIDDKLIVGNEFTISFFWLFKQGWSIIHWNQQFSTNAYSYLCFYVLPLFYFDKHIKTTLMEEVYERTFSLIWFLHKTASLLKIDKMVKIDKESGEICKNDHSSFLFPIYYYSFNDKHKVWKWFWLPSSVKWGVSVVNWLVEYQSSNTYQPIDQRKMASQRVHVSPLYYRTIRYDLSQQDKTIEKDTHYGFWFFTKKLSLIRVWNHKTLNFTKKGFYIFLVVLKYISIRPAELRKTLCLFWMFSKWLSLFHNNVSYTIPSIAQSDNPDDYSSKEHRQYAMSLYFFRHATTANYDTKEFSLFWIFHKYVTFFCIWKDNDEFGWFAYPLVFFRSRKSANKTSKYLSILFLVEKHVSLFFWGHIHDISTTTNKRLCYIFPIFFVEKEKDSTSNNSTTHVFLLWLFDKRIAIAHYWKKIVAGHTDSGFYSFPLVRYTNDSSGPAGKKVDISIFYFFHRHVAIIYFGKDRSTTSCKTMFYVFPLFIRLTFDNSLSNYFETDWSLLFLFYHKIGLVRYWNYVTFSQQETDNKSVRTWKQSKRNQDLCFYIFTLYLFAKKIDQSKLELAHAIAWLFHPILSTIKITLNTINDDFNNSFYIFPLILFHSSKEASTKTKYLSLIWLFHKFVSFFHFGKQVFGDGQILAGGGSDTKDSKITSFILFLYFYASDTRVKEKKWSLFWLFVRQVSFVRYSKSLKEGHKLLKFLVFPFFKFERWSSKESRWCLLPFVPVKFSWVANFMVYTKRVKKTGAVLEDGKEDKSARDQNRYLRVLYKVVVWQYVDQVKSLEINPFFASEHDYTDGYKSWDILGGCLGRVKNSPEHQDACRLFCCCFV